MSNVQAIVQKILDSAVREGKERGLQAAAYHRGRLIVDACAGTADVNTGTPVEKTTLFPVYSTTKGITATVVHLLAERGKLSYDARVAELWPEFGCNGKENITIRQVLRHTSGIPHLPADLSVDEIADWDRMCAEIVKLSPLWEPGSHLEYHALNYGWVLGELAQRADGRPFRQIVADDICGPLGIQDLFVGVPGDQEHRVAFLEEPGAEAADTGANAFVTVPDSTIPLYTWMNRSVARRSCQPAGSGTMTAEAAARVYASLLPGGVDGVELLPPPRVMLAIEPSEFKQEGNPFFGLGYALGEKGSAMGESPLCFGHGGYGGSLGYADLRNEFAFGFTRNLFTPGGDRLVFTLIATILDCLAA